jgi:hypothetical protein
MFFASLPGGSVIGKYGFLPSQGKMRECCVTIQKYDWVSNNAKLNANGWSVPLKICVRRDGFTVVTIQTFNNMELVTVEEEGESSDKRLCS